MRYRALVIPVLGAVLVLAGFLLFGNLNQSLVYNVTPSEAVAQKSTMPADRRFRLGGLVEEGSVTRAGSQVRFALMDSRATVAVVYTGVPTQLFAAGIGAVVEGRWRGDRFVADTLMVKHDSNYRPPTTAADETAVTR